MQHYYSRKERLEVLISGLVLAGIIGLVFFFGVIPWIDSLPPAPGELAGLVK